MIFPTERHRQILLDVQRRGNVRVVDLAERFDVAEETIRRDLEKLDAQGRLVRTHGGAVAIDEPRRDPPFERRASTHAASKRAIAAEAIKRIEPDQVIGLDASSTALELARALPDIPLTVVTCSPVLPPMLADREHVKIVSTGGELDADQMCYVGWVAEHAVRRFNLHIAFLSCRGCEASRGLSEASESHARIKRRMHDLAERTIVLADHSKLGVRSSVFYADVSDADELITDSRADAKQVADLRAAGVTVTQAKSKGATP